MIEAHIDKAVCHTGPEGRSLEVVGWAFAKRGRIVAVPILINGESVGFVPYGLPRADVARHFGAKCPTESVGFEGRVRVPHHLSCQLVLRVRVVFVSSEFEETDLEITVPIAGQNGGMRMDGLSLSPGKPPLQKAEPVATASPRLAAPNFFILGAGKCGTTSLYHSLKQHPEIHLPQIKEPSFFSTGFQVVKNPIEYFNLFPQQPGKKRYGEASHLYFSTPETAAVLRQLFPDAKFLVILRNPVNRAYSLYQHMRRAGDELIPTFEGALKAEDGRWADPAFERNCPQYFWNYMYCRSSQYDVQLERYLTLFPSEQFLVLTLGEWMNATSLWQERIFKFLQVDPSCSVTAEPQNQAGGYPDMKAETRQRLTARFEGLRERVEKLIGRPLEHWEH